jgi:uncharacterized protein YxjI
MERLASVDGLVISQQKEWGEIITGFETKNQYSVMDPSGQQLYTAVEEDGSTLMRLFLKALRPFEITVTDPGRDTILRAKRPFRFYFHELEVVDPRGRVLGRIKRRFSILRRIYTVQDTSGRELFQLFGPLLKPWTFEIMRGGRSHGKITKKWSGLLKEAFSDAENFGITFPKGWDQKARLLLLGAVFLIDFVHFENSNNNN